MEVEKELFMGLCERCNKLCAVSTHICDECRLLEQQNGQSLAAPIQQAEFPTPQPGSNSYQTVPLTNQGGQNDGPDILVRYDLSRFATAPLPVVTDPPVVKNPQTPLPEVEPSYTDMIEHTLQRLNDAARRVSAVEQKKLRSPRGSRLTPVYDVSADIQRHSTPLPAAFGNESNVGEQQLPDLWPWIPEGEADEPDSWAGHTDPLMSRRIPGSADGVVNEKKASGKHWWSIGKKSQPLHRLRRAFICLTILAALALIVDTTLILLALTHKPVANVPKGPPLLTLSSNVATYGQTITVFLSRFPAQSRINLTRDVQEPIHTSSKTPLIQLGQDGSAQVNIAIDTNWEPGFHTIEAEDILTRYTANVTLQVAEGPTRPSHLQLDVSDLDLGAVTQGANLIQPLALRSSGTAPISWSASSDSSWLLVSPSQGVFSDDQIISLGAQSAGLKPGGYRGKITITSVTGETIPIVVSMTVRPLPANAGAVLVLTPPVLTFSAADGGADPDTQSLMISNPGRQPLMWSLASHTSSSNDQGTPGAGTSWLTLDQTSGIVAPGSSTLISVIVHSQNLLAGTYTNTLVFNGGQGAFNSPQNVNVSLSIEPRCSLSLSTGNMSFTAVSGRGNPGNQALTFKTTSGCPASTSWHTSSTANWLTITPSSGQVKAGTSASLVVGVNTTGLAPNTYNATLSIVTPQSTVSVAVQMLVQAPPPPAAPVMAASPLNINFSTVQGNPSPPGQTVTITNSGGSPLQWRTTVNQQASSWLGASPTGGLINAGQTGQLLINVNTSSLTPGTYMGQVILSGTGSNNSVASGSPQTITITLVVASPCVLAAPSASTLTFTATQGQVNPPGQTQTLTASGNCSWPLSWKAHATSSASWLTIAPASGSFTANNQSASLMVFANISGLAAGTYKTQVSVVASDSSNQGARGSPQSFTVVLTIQPPCTLSVAPSSLAFSVSGSTLPAMQVLHINETGDCAQTVNWTAASDQNSSSWLVLSNKAGSDAGTINVSLNGNNLPPPGTYQATITITGSDGSGALHNSPVTIPITLKISSSSVSGAVSFCADSSCTSPQALPGANIVLKNNADNTVATATADQAGNFSLQNVSPGSYTLSGSGSSDNVQYSGAIQITVSGNLQNVALKLVPASSLIRGLSVLFSFIVLAVVWNWRFCHERKF